MTKHEPRIIPLKHIPRLVCAGCGDELMEDEVERAEQHCRGCRHALAKGNAAYGRRMDRLAKERFKKHWKRVDPETLDPRDVFKGFGG
jgi:hypothetical protein